jgi:hypothetical protein
MLKLNLKWTVVFDRITFGVVLIKTDYMFHRGSDRNKVFRGFENQPEVM